MAGGGGEGAVFFPGGARLRVVRVLLDGGAPGDARLPVRVAVSGPAFPGVPPGGKCLPVTSCLACRCGWLVKKKEK